MKILKRHNLTSQQFGRLIAVSFSNVTKNYRTYWLCRCACGNEKIVAASALKAGATQSCGCLRRETTAATARKGIVDLTGQRFNLLTVISLAHTKGGNAHWRCRCDCGNDHVVSAPNLKGSSVQSCGCAKDATIGRKNTDHGDWANRAPEWKAWSSLRERCNNTKGKDYPRYGGRGITVCERWNTYANFLSDMGRRPSPKHSIDRIDNNGPYANDNCRWATAKEQANNRR